MFVEQQRAAPRLNLLEAPTAEPLTIDQVVKHARLGPAVTDDEINRWITTARMRAESYLGRRLITQRWEYLWDYDFPNLLELRISYPPLQSVESVKYIAQTTQQEMTVPASDYHVSTSNGNYNSRPAIIQREIGRTWPVPDWRIEAVKVEVTLGYGDDADAIPAPIIHGMLMLIGHWDRYRTGYAKGPALPDAVRSEWFEMKSEH